MNITWSVQKRRGQAQLQAKWASRWQNFHFGLTCPSSFFLLHCEWMFEGAFWENIKHSICQGTVSTGYKESLMCPLQLPNLASSSAYIDNKHIRLNFHTQEFNPSSHDQPFHLRVNTLAIVIVTIHISQEGEKDTCKKHVTCDKRYSSQIFWFKFFTFREIGSLPPI